MHSTYFEHEKSDYTHIHTYMHTQERENNKASSDQMELIDELG